MTHNPYRWLDRQIRRTRWTFGVLVFLELVLFTWFTMYLVLRCSNPLEQLTMALTGLALSMAVLSGTAIKYSETIEHYIWLWIFHEL